MGCYSFCCAFREKGIESVEQMRTDPLYQALEEGGFFTGQLRSSEVKTEKGSSETKQVLLEVKGMWCGHCCSLIRYLLLHTVSGVKQAWVDYSCDLALIEYDPYQCGAEILSKEITSWGWKAEIFEERERVSGKKLFFMNKKWQLFLMTILSIQVMMLAYPSYMQELGYMVDGDLKALSRLSWLLSFPVLAIMWPAMMRKSFFSLKVLVGSILQREKEKALAALRSLSSIETLALMSTLSAVVLSVVTTIRVELFSQTPRGLYLETAAFILTYLAWSEAIIDRFKGGFVKRVLSMACRDKERVRNKDSNGRYYFYALSELKKGDRFWAIQLDSILCDARVSSGSAWVDRSWRVGEVKARFIEKGDLVYSGDILLRGAVELEASALPKESYQAQLHASLARLLQTRPKEAEQLTEKLLQYFVPLLTLIAVLSFFILSYLLGSFALAAHRSLAVLCIGCPCALSLAEPLLDQSLASLFKKDMNAQLLRPERFRAYGRKLSKKKCHKRWHIFDKTGTLTTGELLIDECTLSGEQLAIALSMAQNSQHPLSATLSSIAAERKLPACSYFSEVPGAGLLSIVERQTGPGFYFLGSIHWIQKQVNKLIDKQIGDKGTFSSHLADKTHTALFKLSENLFIQLAPRLKLAPRGDENLQQPTCTLLGGVSFKEKIRDSARDLVKEYGATNCQILSGDERDSVLKVGEALGIAMCSWGKSPMDKALHINSLKENKEGKKAVVMMLGDGINDSIALAKSDLGIVVTHGKLQALGSIFSSDLQVPDSHFFELSCVPALAKRAKRLSWSNIASASLYNLFAILFALNGTLSPLLSAIAMVLSSIALLANTFKIYLYKKRSRMQNFF